MIGSIRGKLAGVWPEGLLIETGGLGFLVRVPEGQDLPAAGAEVRLFTSLMVREDKLELYGFATREELRLFSLLLGVAGIGPRGAQRIIAAVPLAQLVQAIVAEDAAFLKTFPGIGPKKAARLIVELKDRLLGVAGELGDKAPAVKVSAGAAGEALAALLALGYAAVEIQAPLTQAVRELGEAADTGALLRLALQRLGQKE